MTKVIKSPLAESDFDGVWDYIAEDNPDSATRFLRLIDQKLWTLAQNPMMGRAREELAPSLRSFPVKTHNIFYRPIENGIEVIRVLSAARDLKYLF